VNSLKKAAFRAGLSLPMFSIHQDVVSSDPMERQRHVDITTRSLQLAADLGTPVVRLNSGRWKTIQSFDELMKEGRRAASPRPHAGTTGEDRSEGHDREPLGPRRRPHEHPDHHPRGGEPVLRGLTRPLQVGAPVHAKRWTRFTEVDVARCVRIMTNTGYRGYFAVEYEEQGDGVEGSKRIMKEALAAL
jgi:sugar phosphate isomerase/epimerase